MITFFTWRSCNIAFNNSFQFAIQQRMFLLDFVTSHLIFPNYSLKNKILNYLPIFRYHQIWFLYIELVSGVYNNLYFMYNIDTILSDHFRICYFPFFEHYHVMIHHRYYPGTLWIPKLCHCRLYTMFLNCNTIHHSSIDHFL